MKWIHLTAVVTIALLLFAYNKVIAPAYGKGIKEKKGKIQVGGVFLACLAAAFFLRILLAYFNRGHETDMNCFIGWADLVFDGGIKGFYTSESFTDYPPGYMYVLYVIGAVRNLFGIGANDKLSIILTKLPGILCDVAAGFLLYHIARRNFKESGAIAIGAAYLFLPVILFNSSVWGQVDSVFTLFVLLMCYFVTEKKLIAAYFIFGVGILIKPQTLIFTPILILGIIDCVFLPGFQKKEFFRQLLWGLAAIGFMALLAFPFGIDHVVSQYTETLGSYPYATINGYNLWALFGLNWTSQEGRFLFLTYNQWGTVFILGMIAAVGYLSFRCKQEKSKYFFLGAFLVAGMFMLSVRMHERYMFPALVLLLAAFIYRPRKELFYLFGGLSLVHFYNTVHVYYFYDYQNFDSKAPVPIFIAGASVLVFLLLAYWAFSLYSGKAAQDEENPASSMAEEKTGVTGFQPSKAWEKLGWQDFLIMGVLLVIYSAIALYDLGHRGAPETEWEFKEAGESILLDFGQDVDFSQLSYFLGSFEGRQFRMEISSEPDGGFENLGEFAMDDVFAWAAADIQQYGRYLRLTCLSEKASVLELVVTDGNGQVWVPVNAENYRTLFDEQQFFPERSTFRDSTYFDEIYHARTAYEYIHGLYSYENTHPPLGKIFISLGIRIFGMNPFGWRIMGTLFGIAMVPLLYIFARRLLGPVWLAAVTTVLFTFDFMHFTQTRIATIDVFVTFFIMLMYYFMYWYLNTSFYDAPLKKTFLPLGLCGISMGLAVACKWTGVYAGAGLAILFFWNLYRRYEEFCYAKKSPSEVTGGIVHKEVIAGFKQKTLKTIGFCILFFVVAPVVIYTLSYIPFVDGTGRGLFASMLRNQETMFSYHSHVDASHPYSSWWYQWPVMYRPIWYYSGHVSETVSEGISAFGNPLVWWMGIPAFGCMAALFYKERDKKAGFLMLAYLAQYVPWFFVTRITFIYHYFPSVPFVALMIGYSICRQAEKRPFLRNAAYVYGGAAVVLFFLFYPVLSGAPVDKNFVAMFLRWFDSWVLVS